MSPSGAKFGKTEGGTSVWLDPARTSPYAFYQYWLNVDDRDAATYLRGQDDASVPAMFAAQVVEHLGAQQLG